MMTLSASAPISPLAVLDRIQRAENQGDNDGTLVRPRKLPPLGFFQRFLGALGLNGKVLSERQEHSTAILRFDDQHVAREAILADLRIALKAAENPAANELLGDLERKLTRKNFLADARAIATEASWRAVMAPGVNTRELSQVRDQGKATSATSPADRNVSGLSAQTLVERMVLEVLRERLDKEPAEADVKVVTEKAVALATKRYEQAFLSGTLSSGQLTELANLAATREGL